MDGRDDFGFHRDSWFLAGCAAFWILIFLFAMFGCASLGGLSSTTTAPNPIYKFDMLGTINGVPFDGAGVIPRATSYSVNIQSRVDVDLLAITTCHRDFSSESAIELGWFQSKRGFKYAYTPVPQIESGPGPCILRFGSYNKSSSSQNAWGMVDFEDPVYVLPGVNYCNGNQIVHHGVAVCQSRVGLIQMITFPYATEIDAKDLPSGCAPTSSDGGFTWKYQIQSRECLVVFKEKAVPNRFARLTHLGYNAVLIRGN